LNHAETTTSEVVQEQLPGAIATYLSSEDNIISDLESLQQQAERLTAELRDKAADADVFVSRLRDEEDYSDCDWQEIGYEKTHRKEAGNWCEAGSFLVQLDLDSGGDSPDAYPIVARAKCCSL
jgi:hypothetical protein